MLEFLTNARPPINAKVTAMVGSKGTGMLECWNSGHEVKLFCAIMGSDCVTCSALRVTGQRLRAWNLTFRFSFLNPKSGI